MDSYVDNTNIMDKITPDSPTDNYFSSGAPDQFFKVSSTGTGVTAEGTEVNPGRLNDEFDAWQARNEQALRPESAKEQVLGRFREMVEENWQQLGTLTGLARMCEDLYKGCTALTIDGVITVIDLPDPALPEFDEAPRRFQELYKRLIELRDAGDTPALTSRMIEVETSVYGAGEDDFWLYDLLDDGVVLDDVRRNDDRHVHEDYPDNINNDEIMMSRIHGRVDFEDDPSVYLIKYSGLYHYLNNALGLDVASISVKSRLQLMEYLTTVNRAGLERIASAAQLLPEQKRHVFSEAFLATEFGDDLGDIILHLAEKEPEKSTLVFEQLQDIRKSGKVIAKHFGKEKGIDNAVATAFIKRVTELLAVAEKESVDAVSEELTRLQDVVGQIADAVDNDEFVVVAIGEGADHGTLQAKNHKVTITARPSGGQARLGFTVRYPKGQRINVRLDYDNGQMSLDIAQTSQQANTSVVSRQIGEALARGELAINVRRAEQAIRDGSSRQDITLHGNHVREAFEPMGDVMPEEFSGFVNTFLYSLRMVEDSTGLQTAA